MFQQFFEPMTDMDQKGPLQLYVSRRVLLVTMHLALYSLPWLAGPECFAILAGTDLKDSCPWHVQSYWFFWEMTSVGFCIQRSAWFA